jgi:threonine aldolase
MQPTMDGRGFASDNSTGIHPEILAALEAANEGHVYAYGDDPYTRRMEVRFREVFGEDACVFPVFNGTAANVVALQALLRPFEAAICAETAHVNVDECGAPERFLGSKLLAVPAADGKLTPELVDHRASGWGDQHHVQPRAVSISQSTELGTVYLLEEVRALADHVHGLGMYLHMDGARIANAAAALGAGLREATRDQGVDALSFGGTKNGALAAEAVVVFDPALAEGLEYVRKQGMQLASKMRFLSVQLEALLRDELWRRNADHANTMARRLGAAVAGVPGVEVVQPVEANAVFATLPVDAVAPLHERFPFYVVDERLGLDERVCLVRWMTAWDTTEEDVDAFTRAVAEEVRARS